MYVLLEIRAKVRPNQLELNPPPQIKNISRNQMFPLLKEKFKNSKLLLS